MPTKVEDSRAGAAGALPRAHDPRALEAWTLAVLVVIGVALRVHFIHQPLQYDEAYTYLHFASRGVRAVVTDYHAPNNHVLHTVLVRFSYALFGHEPWALRVPAAVAGVLLIPAVFLVGRLHHGAPAGLVAAAVVAASGWMVGYSVNARGYSMVALLFMVLCLLAWRMVHQPSRRARDWIGFGTVTAIGFLTIPVMAYPAGAAALWVVGAAVRLPAPERRQALRDLGAAVLLGALLTLIFYAPILLSGGTAALVRNEWVTQRPVGEVLWRFMAIPGDAASDWSTGVPGWLGVLLLGAALAGAVRALRGRLPPLWLATALWSVLLLLITMRDPPSRVWLFALPVAAMLAGSGVWWLLSGAGAPGQHRRSRRASVAAIALAVILAVHLVAERGLDPGRYVEQIGFPDAPHAAAYLESELREGDRVLAWVPADAPLEYYMLRRTMDLWVLGWHSNRGLVMTPDGAERLLVVVDPGQGQTAAGVLQRTLQTTATAATPTLLVRFPNGGEVYEVRRE